MNDRSTLSFPLTPEQRLALIAAILARGVLRVRQKSQRPVTENPAVPGSSGLEVVSNLRLSVSGRPEAGDRRP